MESTQQEAAQVQPEINEKKITEIMKELYVSTNCLTVADLDVLQSRIQKLIVLKTGERTLRDEMDKLVGY